MKQARRCQYNTQHVHLLIFSGLQYISDLMYWEMTVIMVHSFTGLVFLLCAPTLRIIKRYENQKLFSNYFTVMQFIRYKIKTKYVMVINE